MVANRTGQGPPGAPTRHALIPLSIVVCFLLVYVAHAPPWCVFPIGLAVMALYLAAPILGQRSLQRFDRDLVQLLAQGRRDELGRRFNRAIAMRLLAPPALVAERKGLVAAEIGRSAAAREAYLSALTEYRADDAPLAVRLGLAHASYALGEDSDAITHYRAVLSRSALPKVARNLAHALARSGADLNEAERLIVDLPRQESEKPRADLRLLEALVHAKRGRTDRAREILAETAGEAPDLRAEVERALDAAPAGAPAQKKKKKKKKAARARPSRPDA